MSSSDASLPLPAPTESTFPQIVSNWVHNENRLISLPLLSQTLHIDRCHAQALLMAHLMKSNELATDSAIAAVTNGKHESGAALIYRTTWCKQSSTIHASSSVDRSATNDAGIKYTVFQLVSGQDLTGSQLANINTVNGGDDDVPLNHHSLCAVQLHPPASSDSINSLDKIKKMQDRRGWKDSLASACERDLAQARDNVVAIAAFAIQNTVLPPIHTSWDWYNHPLHCRIIPSPEMQQRMLSNQREEAVATPTTPTSHSIKSGDEGVRNLTSAPILFAHGVRTQNGSNSNQSSINSCSRYQGTQTSSLAAHTDNTIPATDSSLVSRSKSLPTEDEKENQNAATRSRQNPKSSSLSTTEAVVARKNPVAAKVYIHSSNKSDSFRVVGTADDFVGDMDTDSDLDEEDNEEEVVATDTAENVDKKNENDNDNAHEVEFRQRSLSSSQKRPARKEQPLPKKRPAHNKEQLPPAKHHVHNRLTLESDSEEEKEDAEEEEGQAAPSPMLSTGTGTVSLLFRGTPDKISTRRRRKRLVEKTFQDEHGYLQTEMEEVWEDIPTEPEPMPASASKATSVKCYPKSSPALSKPKKKTGKSTATGFLKQGNLKGFFAKK